MEHAGQMLVLAVWLDELVGDPWGWLHPVQVMGWVILHYTQVVLRWVKQPLLLKLLGAVLTIALLCGSGAVGWLIVWGCDRIHPILGTVTGSILLASCFADRSLNVAVDEVLQPLAAGDLAQARSSLSRYVGRETEQLSESEILRALFETVSENAVDGVLAPLFYALLGLLLPMGSIALALVYKAASTLDSMVGYRTAPYTDIGWFSAKTDDVLTWIPCRLTVLTLGLLSGKPLAVWRICRRDARQDPSPNSGWSECIYAASLDVQVGGINVYRGVVRQKPLLGDPIRPITPERIRAALRRTRSCLLIWLLVGLMGRLVWNTIV